MRMRAATALVFAAAIASAALASAQTRTSKSTSGASSSSAKANVRSLVGSDYAARLLRDADPDERIRGIQRATSIGTPESIALLTQAMESNSSLRSDARALVELARGLARFGDQERARAGLLLLVNAPNPPRTAKEDGDSFARTELAREIAALGLARSGVERAVEQLYDIARTGGSGQNAATLALIAEPPSAPSFYRKASRPASVNIVRMLARIGDLRALEGLHVAAHASDVTVRSAALVALADFGDARAIPLARTALAAPDARLRAAAGEAFVKLAAPERFKVVAALITDEATAPLGVRLAENVHHASISALLGARATSHPDADVRAAAIVALGRSPEAGAASALVAPALLGDPERAYLAALALSRSPAANAMSLVIALARAKATAGLGVRAYVVRALVRGERSDVCDEILARLAESKDGRERSLGVFGRVALGAVDAVSVLADADSRVRRAVAMASLAHPTERTSRALLQKLAIERDEATAPLLAIGLLGGDLDGWVPTTRLLDRAGSGGPDAALSAFAFARRAEEANERAVGELFASRDAVVRAHVARGLSQAPLSSASGRLASAYAYETDEHVRRAIVRALVSRGRDVAAPVRRLTLENATRFDPDFESRQVARLGLGESPSPWGLPIASETAWLRIARKEGAPFDRYVGSLVRSDGVAVPIAFDEDGYAIVPGMPPGEARLVLAPRLPSYKSDVP